MSLSYIAQQFTIYSGFFLLIIGIIGNAINILVFSSVRTYRTTPCTFYYLIASIINIGYLTINFIPHIIIDGYGIDITTTSISWCKLRQFFLITLTSIALSFSCLATIDQFFATSRSAYLRHLSNIKWAHRIALIIIIVWCLHGITLILFYNISSTPNACMITNPGFQIYAVIYLIVISTAIPVIIMMIFGYLAYRNIHSTRALVEQQADRQLTRMILFQVILVVISIAPYGITYTYNVITYRISKDENRINIESFVVEMTVFLWFCHYAGNFYMFWISSSRFRRTVKDQIFFWRRQNQINPTQ